MKQCTLFRSILLLFAVLLLFAGGCGSTAPTRLYILHTLSSAGTEQAAQTEGNSIAIGIGPVTLPEYLDRPQIVKRLSPNELKLSEFNQWAEPLGENFTKVLAENLSMLLYTNHVALYPWSSSTAVDYQIAVDVIQFDSTSGGDVLLRVRWMVRDIEGEKVLLVRKTGYSESANSGDFEAIAAAQSLALERFSRDIAQELISISQKVQ